MKAEYAFIKDGVSGILADADYRPGDDTSVPPIRSAVEDFMNHAVDLGEVGSFVRCTTSIAGAGILVVDVLFERAGDGQLHIYRSVLVPGIQDEYTRTLA